MPTTEYKNIHFICKLKMEAEIACAHTVKLTGPGLIIDKAGVVGDELTYIFDAGEGLIEQDVGIEGPVAGDFKLYGDITSPYFISQGDLKVKKDEINIRILETLADGWYGDEHGIRFGTEANKVDGNLYYRYTSGTTSVTLTVSVAGSFLDGLLHVMVDGPGFHSYVTGASNSINVGLPAGVDERLFIVRPYISGKWGVQLLPDRTFTISQSGVGVLGTTTVKQRGIQIDAGDTFTTPLGVSFTQDFGDTLDSFAPYLSFAFTSYTYCAQVQTNPTNSFIGSVTWDGDKFTASGTWIAGSNPCGQFGSVSAAAQASVPGGGTVTIQSGLSRVG